MFYNCDNSREIYKLKVNCLYLSKWLSKPKYSTNENITISPKTIAISPKTIDISPKTTLLIIMLLLMCGDTGVSLNPGPISVPVVDRCNICEESNITTSYVCNICLSASLPFHNFIDNALDNSLDMIADSNCYSSLNNLTSADWGCFKRKGLHFIHANARSIFHKVSELELISKNTNAAIIAITETWLDESYTDDSIKIEGYNIIRRDRDGHAGGVCAYIREDLAYNYRTDLNSVDLEDLWLEILLPKSKPLYVGVCYRTNNNTHFLECLETTLSMLRTDCDLVLLGDFNICLLKNKNKNNSKLHREYKQLLTFFGCKQIIDKPTRITEHSSSLLDHIIINNSYKIYQSGVLNVGLSDHLMTFCSRKIIRGQIGKHNTVKIRSLKHYSTHDFLIKLRNVNWAAVTNCININEAWNNFRTIFIKILDEVAPIKQVRINTRTEPWMTSTILELIRERDKALFNSNKNRKNKELRKQFNSLRNKVQREIRSAKANYFKNKIEENKGNSKNLWKQLKTIGYREKSKNNSKIVMDIDNSPSFEPKNIADHINKYFLNIASNLVNMLPPALNMFSTNTDLFKNHYHNKNVLPNCFMLNHITDNFVNRELSCLNINKSSGIDEIQARFLKDAASEIKEPITYIVNLSIDTNEVPNDFKYARIKPIFKKGNKNLVENYRPVSILSVVSKILEKAIYIQLEKYLNDNNLLYSQQSGFRSKHSTDTCLIDLMDYLHTNVSKGKYVGMVLLDLQKAFDTVDHVILCDKLNHMGVGCTEWFKSYLNNRQQIVMVDGVSSEPGVVKCGVPQGSILGPLLFLCYINDMPISIRCKLLLYADDSALLVPGLDPETIAETLSQELKSCQMWLVDNKLSLHLGKTESILFGTKRKLALVNEFKVNCNNVEIKSVDNVQYLGIKLDNNLAGESIVLNIIEKSSNRLKFLYRYKDMLNDKCRKIMCSALIQCHFDYCCSSWYSSINKGLQNKLQIMQNKIIRYILNLGNRAHIGVIERERVNMFPVSDRVKQLKLNHMFKVKNGQCPEYMKENFRLIGETDLRIGTRATRNNFFLPRVTGQAIHTFYFSAVKEWNRLPNRIKELTNIDNFKTSLKAYISSEIVNRERSPYIFY